MELFFGGVGLGLLIGLVGGRFMAGRFVRSAVPRFSDDEESAAILNSAHVALAERTERRLNRIMEAARGAGRITNNGVEDLFCISDRTASAYLAILTKEGKLERQGIGRGTFYTPVK